MSTLVFFPWLKFETQLTVNNFKLIPYERGNLPFGPSNDKQAILDKVLENYVERGDVPINRASLLEVNNKELMVDIDQDETNAVFTFSELLAISGLSSRRFFGFGTYEYCNRDIFRPIIQHFSGEYSGCTRTSRRKDGNTKNFTTKEAFRIHKPEYVVHPFNICIDLNLLKSLLYAQSSLDSEQWGAMFEAISIFNLANTDSDYLTEQIEAVLLIGSFERLLDCNGTEEVLSSCFTSILKPREDYKPTDCSRLVSLKVEQRFRNSNTIRDVWIRDFFRLRGNLAHGMLIPRYPSMWNLFDHLLLASFIFPLILKYKLQEKRIYSWTPKDQLYVDVFEKLASVEHCIHYDNSVQLEEYPWNKIFGIEIFKQIEKDASSHNGQE